MKNIDQAARRKAVLAATINKYIKEADPVSSEDIAHEFNLSSATIRNIFAELEEAGYITHPYTSGGRIPTNKGYRYYVDFLTFKMEILDKEKEEIIVEYKRNIDRLEDLLEKTSEVIAMITHYTGIVSFLEWQDKFFYKGISLILDQPEFQELEKMRILIKMIEDKERLVNIINRDFNSKTRVYIGEELGLPEMEGCSLIVSSYYLKDKQLGKLAVLGPKRMQYNHAITTLEYISGILTEVLNRV